MAAQILTAFKQKVSDLKLIPAGGGCFELSAGGQLLYSKLQTGQFPDEGEMVKAVEKHLTAR